MGTETALGLREPARAAVLTCARPAGKSQDSGPTRRLRWRPRSTSSAAQRVDLGYLTSAVRPTQRGTDVRDCDLQVQGVGGGGLEPEAGGETPVPNRRWRARGPPGRRSPGRPPRFGAGRRRVATRRARVPGPSGRRPGGRGPPRGWDVGACAAPPAPSPRRARRRRPRRRGSPRRAPARRPRSRRSAPSPPPALRACSVGQAMREAVPQSKPRGDDRVGAARDRRTAAPTRDGGGRTARRGRAVRRAGAPGRR